MSQQLCFESRLFVPAEVQAKGEVFKTCSRHSGSLMSVSFSQESVVRQCAMSSISTGSINTPSKFNSQTINRDTREGRYCECRLRTTEDGLHGSRSISQHAGVACDAGIDGP